MGPERYQRLKDIFAGAVDLDAGARADFLARACAGDAGLRAEVETLLACEGPAAGFLEESAFEVAARMLWEGEGRPPGGGRIGPYRVLREVGRGGMGVVYLAERDDEQFRKLVAVKLVKRGMDTDAVVRRFRNERQILAGLEHPHIARLLDGGATEEGLPYLVMEYVEGRPFTDYCDERRLTTNERLRLFREVCAAVAYAHQRLVVHRDLKPSNILITSDGVPKLLDFGVAKVLDPERTEMTGEQTRADLRVLTPDYASPEQVRGERVTTATDIYSLGVVLYEILTGHRPYRLKAHSTEELMRAVCEEEPERLSTAAGRTEEVAGGGAQTTRKQTPARVSAVRAGRAERLSRRLRGDLDNIVLKAMRKEPQRRYASAQELSEDIRRHLEGLPVRARPDTLAYRTSKFVGRNKVGVAAAALVLSVVVAGLVSTAWQGRIAARERDQAKAEQAKAEQLNKFLQSILSAASPEEKGRDAKVIEVLNDAAARVDKELAGQPALRAQALHTIGQTYTSIGLEDEAERTLREALTLETGLYSEENKTTASSMTLLGGVLMNKGRYDESEALLLKAVETERRLSAAGGKELAGGLFTLGELYVRRGEYEKAKTLLREAVSLADEISGPQNEDSALVRISLGRAEQYSGDLDGAESTYRSSIAIYRGLPQRYESRLGLALLNLGLLLTAKGKFDEGIGAIREADGIFQKQGETFVSFEAKSYLCDAYSNHGDYGPAVDDCAKAVGVGRKLGLADTPDFILALNDLGLSLTRTGRAPEAEPVLRESLDRAKKGLPPPDVRTPLIEGALGECLTAQRRYGEAEPLLVESYESVKASQGAQSPLVKPVLLRLVTLYEAWGKPDGVARYRALM